MAWIFLLTAGLLEIAWATGLKKLGQSPTWAIGTLTSLAMILSLVTLYVAMTRLPLGIAYPIWTGIGSVGSVMVSVLFFNQNLSWASIVGMILLLAGMFLLGSEAH